MTSGPGFRLTRAAIFAAVCVVTTAMGHALMSGDGLPGWAVGYAFAATTAGAWWLTGKERGALAVTVATVATQFVLHLGFSLTEVVGGRAATAPTGHHMAHMPGMDMGVATSAASAGHGWSAGMVLAHALAAFVCGLWMWRGEKAASGSAGHWQPASSHRCAAPTALSPSRASAWHYVGFWRFPRRAGHARPCCTTWSRAGARRDVRSADRPSRGSFRVSANPRFFCDGRSTGAPVNDSRAGFLALAPPACPVGRAPPTHPKDPRR